MRALAVGDDRSRQRPCGNMVLLGQEDPGGSGEKKQLSARSALVS